MTEILAEEMGTDREFRSSFEALFVTEWPRVMRIALRIVDNESAAKDVAQDVFLAFYRRFGEDSPEWAAAYLHKAALHAALNARRGEMRRQGRERLETPDLTQGPLEPAEVLARQESRREVRLALSQLRPAQAAILALRYSGLSYGEIGKVLEVPLDQVGTRLRRAEAALRKELQHATRERRNPAPAPR